MGKDDQVMFERIFEASPDATIVATAEGRIARINRQGEALFGYDRRELLGREIEVLVPDRFREVHAGHRWEYLTGARIRAMGTGLDPYARRQDGSEFPVDVMLSPMETEQGTYVLAIVRDVTDERRMEATLRDSERRYRALFDRNLAGVFRSAPDGRMLDCNDAFARILGYVSRHDAQARLAHDFFFEATERDAHIARVVERGTLTNFEMCLRRKDGSPVWVLANVSGVDVEAGRPEAFEGTVLDITERRRAEDERRALEEQLRQSQRMEAVGNLAAGVAHDFNNLLTVILGYCEFLLERLRPEDSLRGEVTEIRAAADRAASLTRQLLAFGRRQVLQPQILDLNVVMHNVAKLLSRVIGEHVELMTVPGPNLGRIKADPGQIEQVIMNLAVNARDAMPGGGILTFETNNAVLTETDAGRQYSVRPGAYVMLAVRDNGSGMDAETQARIFEPFFTTKERGKGTGLGLATVYGIVKQSEGYIEVDSTPGQGATFRVYLPRVEDEPISMGTSPTAATTSRGWETVLVVEDEASVRAVIRGALEVKGYHVLEAASGDEALSMADHHDGPIHVLVTDSWMPGLPGRELAQRLTAARPHLCVLYVSRYSDDGLMRQGPLQPNEAFLPKPFKPDALARKVREILDKPS